MFRGLVLGRLCLAALALVAAALVAGCAAPPAREGSAFESADVHVELDAGSPWHLTSSATPAEEARDRPSGVTPAGESSRGAVVVPAAPRPPAEPPQRPRPAPTVPVPAARGLGQVAARGAVPVKSVEATARERFLDHPTEVRAQSLTLVLPARLLAEARLTGATVEEPAPGRRVASGGARLTCRELTLVGERITLRTREAGSEDVQITARGRVAFVSRQGDQVVREEGLKTLIVTNDRLTPLR